jgi:hypothetical protein
VAVRLAGADDRKGGGEKGKGKGKAGKKSEGKSE